RLYAYARLETVPVYVVYAIERNTIFKPWRQQLRRYGVLDGVIMLCLVAMTAFAMRHVRLQQRAAEALGAEVEGRKRAEAEAQKSQEGYRFLYLKTPVMLHSIDPAARIVNVSDFWLEHSGYARDEVIGRRLSDFVTADSRARLQGVAFPTLR